MDIGLVLREVGVEVLELRGEVLFEVLLAEDYRVFGQDFYLELVEAVGHFLGGEAMLFLELDQPDDQKEQSQRVVLHPQQALDDLSVSLLAYHHLISHRFVYLREIFQ